VKARARAKGTLVSVDGVSGSAVMRAVKKLASADRGARAGISRWDASGIFGDLDVAGPDVQRPSARTLLLLYAADLAFRLRWEIRPALAEGRRVIAAPYVDTAIALGRAAGIDEAWLGTTFDFAPVPAERRYVEDAAAATASGHGFIEFACRRLAGMETRSVRQDLVTRTHARLKATRHRSRA
jgi:hypothetical protein